MVGDSSAQQHPERTATATIAVDDATTALCVDLDGTLIKGDLLWESLIQLVRQRPMSALELPLWLARGKAVLKRRVASEVQPVADLVPLREQVVDLVREARMQGRRTMVVTASDGEAARPVVAPLGLFDDVIASDGATNMRAGAKVDAIRARIGAAPFDYIGDSFADLPVWKEARRAIAVDPSRSLLRSLRRQNDEVEVIRSGRGSAASLVRALRPHQWAKNVLVFVPLVTSHQVLDTAKAAAALVAFVCLCLAASGTYILNDMLDVHADRAHERKRRRPFAAGDLSLPTGALAAIILLAAGMGLAVGLGSPLLAGLMALYVATTTTYSVYLKRKVFLDVLVLAGLYTLRVLIGGVAAEVAVSDWLMTLCVFLFLSLALAKRYCELASTELDGHGLLLNRGYRAGDLELISSAGVVSGYLAVLVCGLYINSDAVLGLYARPTWLWLICPIMIYWITRVWFLARRGELHDDPVVFALRDRISYFAAAAVAVVVLVATA